MAMKITEELRAKAEVYYGDEMCQEKTKLLLKEVGLPNGLLPLKDIMECGYIEETGFVWLKQKKKVDHFFEKIGRVVSYAPEITAYAEKSKIRKVTGVKAKELLLWITINEIAVDERPTGKLVCRSTAGLFRTFPTSAFEVAEKDKERKEDQVSASSGAATGTTTTTPAAPAAPPAAAAALEK
ncbi:uncharacterized protein LOC109719349 [Ananas comosus]|uniref:Uncharacterized protein LOC109719349 n=1 Tax=Ananas comosus TaxID=4615 RepID=A0A6P5G6Z9_ANACO|nr:uncharacterized protein LOC109719349 [Ananas comosus]